MPEWLNGQVSKTLGANFGPREFESRSHRMEEVVLESAAIVVRRGSRKNFWLITKESSESNWEIPKVIVRKGESSVRAAIRTMGERANMDAKVIEEAGRSGGLATVNDKTVSKRQIYYLMVQKNIGEIIGFEDYKWLEYGKMVRKLKSKRERQMVKSARVEWKKWLKGENEKGPSLD